MVCSSSLVYSGQGLERSTTTGAMDKNGKFARPTNQARTSSNAWCFNQCFTDPKVKAIDKRVAEVLSRPPDNMEHFQLLHYNVGQEYQMHHDFIYDQSKMAQGARQFTFFLYLNDVEEGGETRFPYLNLTVKPIKRAALLWPNTDYPANRGHSVPGKPARELKSTFHAAMPVIKGEEGVEVPWIRIDL